MRPGWLKVGTPVLYHPVIGDERRVRPTETTHAPFPASSGQWVTFVVGVRGYVACAALTPAEATCRECGCTETRACDVGGRGCFWREAPDSYTRLGLCSACSTERGRA